MPALGAIGSSKPRVSRVTAGWELVVTWLRHLLKHWYDRWACDTDGYRAYFTMRKNLLQYNWRRLGQSRNAKGFQWFRQYFTSESLQDRDFVVAVLDSAIRIAKEARDYDVLNRNRRWSLWLQAGPAKGLGRQQRMSRTQEGWVPASLGQDGCVDEEVEFSEADMEHGGPSNHEKCVSGVPLDQQQSVDLAAKEWARIWTDPGDNAISWPPSLGLSMRQLTVDDVRIACRTFPTGVGLGWDKCHPRAIARCSDAVISQLVALFHEAERVGRWPTRIGGTVVMLIPKSDGGRRPIGLMPTLIRIWMKCRLPEARRWSAANERCYFYGGPGKGAEVASWRQAFMAESALAQSQDYVCILLDIVKAFDTVAFDRLVQAATANNYNLFLLRLSIATYKVERVISIDGVVAVPCFASRGITAGSVLATIEMRVLLQALGDHILIAAPNSCVTMYVDDVSIELAGCARRIASEAGRALKSVADQAQHLRLQLSDTKNVVIASRLKLAQEVAQGNSRVSLKVGYFTESLGCGLGAGIRRQAATIKKRLIKFRARRSRFLRLRAAGVNCARLLRTGGNAALLYGTAMGVSGFMLLQQRRAAAACLNLANRSANIDITLMLADETRDGRADPAFQAHIGVIGMWALAIWEKWHSRLLVWKSFQYCVRLLNNKGAKWALAKGPVAAMILTAKRLGWKTPSPYRMVTDTGNVVDFRKLSPRYVKQMVHESVVRWRRRRIEKAMPALKSNFGAIGANWRVARHLLKDKKTAGWNDKHKAYLCSVLAGRQWPQQRLFKAGLVDNPFCRLCVGENGTGAIGTLMHRLRCSRRREVRDRHMPEWLKLQLNNQLEMSQREFLACTRGLVADGLSGESCAKPVTEIEWIVGGDNIPEGCRVFTDGSRLDSGLPTEMQAFGWSFAVLDQDDRVVAAARGHPPRWVQSIFGAELVAMQQALERISLPARVYTDCRSVFVGCGNSFEWASSANRKYAPLWMKVIKALAGRADVVRWMPAHLTSTALGAIADSHGELISHSMWGANRLADELAKLAAQGMRVDINIRERFLMHEEKAKDLLRFIALNTAAANNFYAADGVIIRDTQAKSKLARPRCVDRRRSDKAPASSPQVCNVRMLAPKVEVACLVSVPRIDHRAEFRLRRRAADDIFVARRAQEFSDGASSSNAPPLQQRLDAIRRRIAGRLSF